MKIFWVKIFWVKFFWVKSFFGEIFFLMKGQKVDMFMFKQDLPPGKSPKYDVPLATDTCEMDFWDMWLKILGHLAFWGIW